MSTIGETDRLPETAVPENGLAEAASLQPHVIVLFGATGDLARRKLLPGLLRLSHAGLLPECQIVGTSLDDFDDLDFHNFALTACEEFAPPTSSSHTGPPSRPAFTTSPNSTVRPLSPRQSCEPNRHSAGRAGASTT